MQKTQCEEFQKCTQYLSSRFWLLLRSLHSIWRVSRLFVSYSNLAMRLKKYKKNKVETISEKSMPEKIICGGNISLTKMFPAKN